MFILPVPRACDKLSAHRGYIACAWSAPEVSVCFQLIMMAKVCVRIANHLGLQLPKRVPAPSFLTGLALSSVDSLRRQGTQKVHGAFYCEINVWTLQ